MRTVNPNDRCPCGSGKKFKRCCQSTGGGSRYTLEDRFSTWKKLTRFIKRELDDDWDEALEEFWGDWLDRSTELEPNQRAISEQAFELWFVFDRPLDDGSLVVDRFLDDRAADLFEGEKLYLRTLRASSMRLYEVEDSRPGESLSLRDLLEGDRVTVQERAGSRCLHRFDWIAARVLPAAASGKPEIEGLVPIPDFYQKGLRDQLRKARDSFLEAKPGATVGFYKTMPPNFHDVFARSYLDPYIPQLANTDGEELVATNVLFDVLDRQAVAGALGKVEGLEREDREADVWHWSGKNSKGEPIGLGVFKLHEQTLDLEMNSVARGERGRALVEAAAGAALRHRATTHEDMQRKLRESLRKGESTAPPKDEIPPDIQEALVLDHYAHYYRKWLDEPVPALDGRTPREAAKDPALRPRLIELAHDFDRMYQRSLKMGDPAFDPSWMWDELGLEDEAASHPPPLAPERVARLVPGSGEVCHAVAEALRRQPGFRDAATVASEEELRSNLETQRFLREQSAASAKLLPGAGSSFSAYLERMVNFDLHRRKAFWVDESLAYMLAQTDLDVVGRELRVPFPSFALVFTDRHVLSMAERLLARQKDCALSGQYLRVATVFVTEDRRGDERTLRICFALDALGADLPFLVDHAIPLKDDQKVEAHLDAIAPAPQVEPAVPNASPLRGLLQVTINAVLYATSAGVEPQPRKAPAKTKGGPRARGGPPITFSSEEVYFLPGAIEISQVRRLRDLERVHEGREILRRFTVRGHWRRAAAGWSDQRMRWIQPYWKGPDMAGIIERTYKLKP